MARFYILNFWRKNQIVFNNLNQTLKNPLNIIHFGSERDGSDIEQRSKEISKKILKASES